MYGLPQAEILANLHLRKLLEPHGYASMEHTLGLWKQKWRPIMFTLVVVNFSIQYTGKEHAHDLLACIMQEYKVIEDWEGTLYCGITLKWDYIKRTCELFIPGYIRRALQIYQHRAPRKPQHSPHPWTKQQYGVNIQWTEEVDESAELNPGETKRVQQVLGTLLFYAQEVDSALLLAMGAIFTCMSLGTVKKMQAVDKFFDYCSTPAETTIQYRASNMVIQIHTDASYLSETEAGNQARGVFLSWISAQRR